MVSATGNRSGRTQARAPARRSFASTVSVDSHATYVPGSPRASAAPWQNASAAPRLPRSPAGTPADVTNTKFSPGGASAVGASDPAASSGAVQVGRPGSWDRLSAKQARPLRQP